MVGWGEIATTNRKRERLKEVMTLKCIESDAKIEASFRFTLMVNPVASVMYIGCVKYDGLVTSQASPS